MFATGSATCPVTIFKEFLSRRPPEIRPTGPLYLSCVSNLGILASLVPATADGSEQAQRNDEGFKKKKTILEDSLKTFPTTAPGKQ